MKGRQYQITGAEMSTVTTQENTNTTTPAPAAAAMPTAEMRWIDIAEREEEMPVMGVDTTDYLSREQKEERTRNLEQSRATSSSTLRWWKRENLYYSGSDPLQPYVRWNGKERNVVKWGQLKLLLSELQLLTTFWDNNDLPNPIVVYAGAAPGIHLHLLVELFPQIEWHLYDTREFKVPNKRTTIHREYFTDEIAQQWALQRERVIFISDIRTVSHTTSANSEVESGIMKDMEDQQRWHEIIEPALALLKFRMPYYHPRGLQNYVYLCGHLMYQSFNGADSSEMRLVPLRNNSGKYFTAKYGVERYENRLFYHNAVVRHSYKYYFGTLPGGRCDMGCYDILHLLTVCEDYLRISGKLQTIANSRDQARYTLAFAHLLVEMLNLHSEKKVSFEQLRKGMNVEIQ